MKQTSITEIATEVLEAAPIGTLGVVVAVGDEEGLVGVEDGLEDGVDEGEPVTGVLAGDPS